LQEPAWGDFACVSVYVCAKNPPSLLCDVTVVRETPLCSDFADWSADILIVIVIALLCYDYDYIFANLTPCTQKFASLLVVGAPEGSTWSIRRYCLQPKNMHWKEDKTTVVFAYRAKA